MKEPKHLPNNTFGVLVMLVLLILIVLVPFVVTVWAVGKFAPWWVSGPCAFLASVLVFLRTVTFKQ